MKYFYFDTSIWMDIYDKRGVHGDVAKKLLEKIIHEDFFVVYSDVIFTELKRLNYSDFEINQMLSIAKPNHIKRIQSTKEQIEEAVRLAWQRDVPFRDALHALICRDHDLQLVSRDWDFEKLKDVARAMKPEDLV